MKKIETTGVLVAIFLLVAFFSAEAFAGGRGIGGNPRGRPFIKVADQIIEIEGEISTLQDQVDSLQEQVLTIEEKVEVNIESIASLEEQTAILQWILNFYGEDLATMQAGIEDLEAQNAVLQAQVDANGGDIVALQAEIDTNNGLISALEQNVSELDVSLQDQIDNNVALIAAMEAEIAAINAVLDEKQRIISGSCPAGQSIQQIYADGSVVCEIDDIGETAGNIDRVVVGQWFFMSPGQYSEVETLCPDGYTVTGGSFLSAVEGVVLGSIATNEGWKVFLENNNSIQVYVITGANCIKIVTP